MIATRKFISFITGLCGVILFFLFLTAANAARVDKVYPTTVPGAEFVGDDTCAMCHAKQVGEYKNSIHGHFAISKKEPKKEPKKGSKKESKEVTKEEAEVKVLSEEAFKAKAKAKEELEKEIEDKGCESCHGAGSKHVDAGGGKGIFIINPRKNPEMCFKCHLEKKAQFNLQYHHPVIEGKVSCADCHNVHSEDAIPGSTTSLDEHNEVCFKCHPDKKGPYVFEHSAVREGCESCHQVHGSVNNKMLQVKDNNLCLKCHYEQRYNALNSSASVNPNNVGMYIGAWPHWHGFADGQVMSVAAYGRTSCVSCHVDVHGSNFHPRFTQFNNKTSCAICH